MNWMESDEKTRQMIWALSGLEPLSDEELKRLEVRAITEGPTSDWAKMMMEINRLKALVWFSMLPQIVTETGEDGEPVLERIDCDAIDGGAQFLDNMPQGLSLMRTLADGTQFRMRYVQESFLPQNRNPAGHG